MSTKHNGLGVEFITNQEQEVIVLIGKGLKNNEIAERLSISETAVRHHLSSIYRKLNVEDNLNLIICAYQKGLLQLYK